MAVRTAYPATEVAGDVLTAANFDKLPGGWIGYAQVVATQGSITSEADLTSLTVTVTVNTSRRIKITGHAPMQNDTASTGVSLRIKEGATTLQRADEASPTANADVQVNSMVIVTPSAGSHSYKLAGARGLALGGTVTVNAGSTNPAFILCEDIGPA